MELITCEKAFYLLIMTTMISLPICELLVEQHDRNFEGQPIIVEAAGIAGIVMVVGHLVIHKGISYYPTDVIYALLMIFCGLSLAMSENLLASIQGYDYDEWLTHFMAYFSLMYAGTMVRDMKLRRNIVKAFIFVLVLQGGIGLLQSFGIEFTNCFFDSEFVTEHSWAYGLTPHFNWYAALMTLASGCAMGIAIFAKERKRFLIFLGLSALGVYALLATETRLALVSLAVLLLFFPVSLLIFRAVRKNREVFRLSMLRWLAVALVTVGIFAVLMFGFGRFKSEIADTLNEIGALSSSSSGQADTDSSQADDSSAADTDDSSADDSSTADLNGFLGLDEDLGPYFADDTAIGHFANNRGHIWRYGLACVPDHWMFGVGLDNYRWCFSHAPDLPHNTWSQGKAHNEYIHYLVTQGAFQLLTYLSFIIYAFVVGIRTVLRTEDDERRFMTWTLLAMFTAYVVQALFNSSVVNIAPYFWITAGMVLCKDDQRPFGYRKSRS
ncbi:MAG: O-antigen ligase family protein [Ruminococcus sp.]|nr:O-antigen ligase family protein [Ruminococcus sp.]